MHHPLTNNSKSNYYPTGCVAQLRAFVPSCDKIELPKSFPFALSALSALSAVKQSYSPKPFPFTLSALSALSAVKQSYSPKSFPFALSALSASLRDKFFPANPTDFSPLPTFFFISPPFLAFSLYSFVLFCVLSWLNYFPLFCPLPLSFVAKS
jgi:hypothetical protein